MARAKADALLHALVARAGDELRLREHDYGRLREQGLSRAEIARAVDLLVDEGKVVVSAEHGVVVLREVPA